jgi:two-component system, LytTR family, response regulator
MKRKVLIIDDEPDARLLIRQYVDANPNFEIIGEYDNGFDAVAAINELEPDLVFLDVKMPGLSGMQVAQKIIHIPQIIFTTAYDQYALRAFDANAIDYLLKPYTRERFDRAIAKILHRDRPQADSARPPSGLPVDKGNEMISTILVESGSKLISLDLKDIECIEADKDYTWLHTAGKSFLSNYGISQLELRLPQHMFLRVHRSFMINVQHIKEVHKEGASAQLTTCNNRTINISRTYMPALKKLMY